MKHLTTVAATGKVLRELVSVFNHIMMRIFHHLILQCTGLCERIRLDFLSLVFDSSVCTLPSFFLTLQLWAVVICSFLTHKGYYSSSLASVLFSLSVFKVSVTYCRRLGRCDSTALDFFPPSRFRQCFRIPDLKNTACHLYCLSYR